MSLSEYVRREDLKALYALPMKEASKKLGVSESSLRNICRKHNIERWPYRKFQQLDAHIASLQNVDSTQQSAQQREMIDSLLRARLILEENPNMTCEMAILQANKQQGTSTSNILPLLTSQQFSEDDSPSPTTNPSNASPQQTWWNGNNMSPPVGSNNGSVFVPTYPLHVSSHLSTSGALSAMARRKRNIQEQYSQTSVGTEQIARSNSFVLPSQQQYHSPINQEQSMHRTNSASHLTYDRSPQHVQQQWNGVSVLDSISSNTSNSSSTLKKIHSFSFGHQMQGNNYNRLSTGIDNTVPHRSSDTDIMSLPHNMRRSSESSTISLNSSSVNSDQTELGRRFAVSQRDSIAFQLPPRVYVSESDDGMLDDDAPVEYDENMPLDGKRISETSDHRSAVVTPRDLPDQCYDQFMQGGFPNQKSRHISLMKEQRQHQQYVRSLSTSTASTSPNQHAMGIHSQFLSPVFNKASPSNVSPSSSFPSIHGSPVHSGNSSHRSSNASSVVSDVDEMNDEDDAIMVHTNSQQSGHNHHRNVSLTGQISLNRLLFDSTTDDFEGISKQQQRETNHRILEALKSAPMSPVNPNGGQLASSNYDPMFNSDMFLRGRTSSASSYSEAITPATPPNTDQRLMVMEGNVAYGSNMKQGNNFVANNFY